MGFFSVVYTREATLGNKANRKQFK